MGHNPEEIFSVLVGGILRWNATLGGLIKTHIGMRDVENR